MKKKIIEDLGIPEIIGDVGHSQSEYFHKGIDVGESSSNDEIEQKPQVVKPKRVLTQRQMDTLTKGRETRDVKRKERLTEKQRQEIEQKREMEEKIVKKAIAIKKKQIKKEKIIEPTPSDDEEEEDEIPPPTRRKPQPKQAAPRAPVLHSPSEYSHKGIASQARQPKIIFI